MKLYFFRQQQQTHILIMDQHNYLQSWLGLVFFGWKAVNQSDPTVEISMERIWYLKPFWYKKTRFDSSYLKKAANLGLI